MSYPDMTESQFNGPPVTNVPGRKYVKMIRFDTGVVGELESLLNDGWTMETHNSVYDSVWGRVDHYVILTKESDR